MTQTATDHKFCTALATIESEPAPEPTLTEKERRELFKARSIETLRDYYLPIGATIYTTRTGKNACKFLAVIHDATTLPGHRGSARIENITFEVCAAIGLRPNYKTGHANTRGNLGAEINYLSRVLHGEGGRLTHRDI